MSAPTQDRTGAKAAPTVLDLPVQGMTCASCANRIERKLNKLDGVQASVNYATENANVSYDEALVTPEQLLATVEAAGYTATLPAPKPDDRGPGEGEEAASDDPVRSLRQRLILSWALALPVLALSMVPPLQFDNWQWIALQLTTPVVLWGAWPFHRAAWTNLRHGAATMDTLVSMGALVSWLYSVGVLLFTSAGDPGFGMQFELLAFGHTGPQLYLEVGAALTAFLLAGRYLEARAKRNSGAALEGSAGARCQGGLPAGRRRHRDKGGRGRAGRGRPFRRPTGREDCH